MGHPVWRGNGTSSTEREWDIQYGEGMGHPVRRGNGTSSTEREWDIQYGDGMGSLGQHDLWLNTQEVAQRC